MKKEQADKIITEYLQKIYGFAVKKAFSYDEAGKSLTIRVTFADKTRTLTRDEVNKVIAELAAKGIALKAEICNINAHPQ